MDTQASGTFKGKKKAKEFNATPMVASMRATGIRINLTEGVESYSQLEKYIKVSVKTGWPMDKEF